MSIGGSVAVVTGSARGVGRAIAEALLEGGARVALADVLGDVLDVTRGDLAARGEVIAVATDTTDAESVSRLQARVAEELGPVDLLVNNAGTFSSIAPVWETDPEKWFRDIRVNLYGSFLCCRAFSGAMVARGVGTIVNIVSSGGVGDPHPYSTGYACSKTGLMRLTEGLHAEMKEHGVRVYAVGPPAIKTDMTRFILEDAGGKKWRPTFSKTFEEGRDFPATGVGAFIRDLANAAPDCLSGRFLDPRKDLGEYLADAERIVKEDLYTLRIRGR